MKAWDVIKRQHVSANQTKGQKHGEKGKNLGVNVESEDTTPFKQKQIHVEGYGENPWNTNQINQERIEVIPRRNMSFIFT